VVFAAGGVDWGLFGGGQLFAFCGAVVDRGLLLTAKGLGYERTEL